MPSFSVPLLTLRRESTAPTHSILWLYFRRIVSQPDILWGYNYVVELYRCGRFGGCVRQLVLRRHRHLVRRLLDIVNVQLFLR
jgi:hypothetical protein